MQPTRKLTGLAAAAAVLAGVLVPVAVSAPASAAKRADCVVSDPGYFDNYLWTAYSDNGGKAEWHEWKDHLEVIDTSSNGRRTVVDVRWCYNGKWRHYGTYDSGPNEGKTDKQSYYLSFKEGRRLSIKVGERAPGGNIVHSGKRVRAVA